MENMENRPNDNSKDQLRGNSTYHPDHSPINWDAKTDSPIDICKPVVWNFTPGEVLAPEPEPHTTFEKIGTPLSLPKTKSLLSVLDRFLSRNFFVVFAFYFTAAVVLGTAIIISNTPGSGADTGGGGTGTSNPLGYWLFAILGTLTFIFVLVLIYFIVRHKHIKECKKQPTK